MKLNVTANSNGAFFEINRHHGYVYPISPIGHNENDTRRSEVIPMVDAGNSLQALMGHQRTNNQLNRFPIGELIDAATFLILMPTNERHSRY